MDANVNCAADTDPELSYTSVFGLFLILVGGALTAFLLFMLEVVMEGMKKLFKKKKATDRNGAITQLVHLTEKERLSVELGKLREKLRERDELIMRLQQVIQEERKAEMEIRIVEAED